MEINVAGAERLRRSSTGEQIGGRTGVFLLTLKPYELQTYEAPAGARITRVEQTIPAAELARVSRHVAWLNDLATRLKNPLAALLIGSAERQAVAAAATAASAALQRKHYWLARTTVERANLVKVYVKLDTYPPDFRDALVDPVQQAEGPKK
jgi:hypothetical protein